MSRKNEAILCHKLVVLHTLTMQTLDDLKMGGEFKEGHKKAFEPAMEFVESFLDKSTVLDNSTNNYIFELSKKIDTIMRKNYKPQ